jgi:hypothetical protein
VYQKGIAPAPEEAQEICYLVREWSRQGGCLILPDYIELQHLDGAPLPVLSSLDSTKCYKIKDYVSNPDNEMWWRIGNTCLIANEINHDMIDWDIPIHEVKMTSGRVMWVLRTVGIDSEECIARLTSGIEGECNMRVMNTNSKDAKPTDMVLKVNGVIIGKIESIRLLDRDIPNVYELGEGPYVMPATGTIRFTTTITRNDFDDLLMTFGGDFDDA